MLKRAKVGINDNGYSEKRSAQSYLGSHASTGEPPGGTCNGTCNGSCGSSCGAGDGDEKPKEPKPASCSGGK